MTNYHTFSTNFSNLCVNIEKDTYIKMKKITFSLLAFTFLLASQSLVFAAENVNYVGQNISTVNLNVRSGPLMGDNINGLLTKGEATIVSEVRNGWCKIPYKTYSQAYVYCSYLQPTTQISVVAQQPVVSTSQPAPNPADSTVSSTPSKLLGNIVQWLSVNDEGNSYISDSYWNGNQKAQVWSHDAKLAQFYFEYAPWRDQYCHMIFLSETLPKELFKSWCFSKTNGAIETITVANHSPLTSMDLPELTFTDFVLNLRNNLPLMNEIDTYFADSTHVRAIFTLDKASAESSPVWRARFFDEQSGLFFMVSSDADKALTDFKSEKGAFANYQNTF